MKVFQSRLFAASVASAVTALLVGGIAWAAVPGRNGVISGCYNNKTGALRVIDASKGKCPSGSTRLTWNQKGATGPKGATGVQGPQGSAPLLRAQPVPAITGLALSTA